MLVYNGRGGHQSVLNIKINYSLFISMDSPTGKCLITFNRGVVTDTVKLVRKAYQK